MKHKGFSLAEILITLVILGFVGALGVPMIGQHKLKKPNRIILKHGILECYYDADGNLHQNKVGNTKLSDDDETPEGDSIIDGDACYFKAPTASLFVLQAVGAGGTGAYTDDEGKIPSYFSKEFELSGDIRTDENFQNDINRGVDDDTVPIEDAVPDWVRSWSAWHTFWQNGRHVTYTLTSPVGKSGNGFCQQTEIEDTEIWVQYDCSAYCEVLPSYSCDRACLDQKPLRGGSSGKPGRVAFSAKLYPNHNVIFDVGESKTQLTISGLGWAYLTSSGDGQNADVNHGNPTQGHDFTDANIHVSGDLSYNSFSPLSAQPGGIGCEPDESGHPRKVGSITVSPSAIRYSGKTLGINAFYGKAGEPGETVMKVLENIPKGVEFKFVPAKDSSKASYVYIKNKNGEWPENPSAAFVIARSGGNSNFVYGEHIPIQGEEDLPFPKRYYPDKFKAVEPEFVVSGYKSKIARLGFIPGTSGEGAYPFVDKVTGVSGHFLGYGYSDVQVGGSSMSSEGWQQPERKCLDNKPLPLEKSYCGDVNTKGKPGAVVMSW